MYIPRLQTQKVQIMVKIKIFIALLLCVIFSVIWLHVVPTIVNASEPLEVGNYYFTAEWCGPCQSQSKVVARLQEQGYVFTIYDADAHPDIFKDLNIKEIPMIIIVKDTILKLKGKQPIRKLIRLLVKQND